MVYRMLVGPIPENMELDHLCRKRSCVNPDHLEPVTQIENNRRSDSVSAKNRRKTHCKFGHEFTSDNTVLVKGMRHCKECNRIKCREYYRRTNTHRKTRRPTLGPHGSGSSRDHGDVEIYDLRVAP